MLSSIHPLGERARAGQYWVTAVAYVVGSTVGGLSVGALFGVAGGALLPSLGTTALAWIAVAIGTAGVLVDTGMLPLPSIHRQVNEEWLTTYRGWVYGVGFGFQLGAGLATIVTTAATYAIVALAFFSGSAATGMVIGLTFGFVRSLAIFAVARVHTLEALRSLHRSMQRRAPLAHRAVIAAQLLILVAGVATWR
jgi:hypothetical protein